MENGEIQTETGEVTEERTDETEEMLASSKCKRRKCGYCGIYVSHWLHLEMPKFPTSANFITSYEVPKYCFLD